MDRIAKEMGHIIAQYRAKQGFSQEKLADLAQIHRTYVSQIERGLKQPTIFILVKIAIALEVKLSELIIELEKKI